jgi:hypothetical protein
MAFADSGRHPQWPKLADAVIEAAKSAWTIFSLGLVRTVGS